MKIQLGMNDLLVCIATGFGWRRNKAMREIKVDCPSPHFDCLWTASAIEGLMFI